MLREQESDSSQRCVLGVFLGAVFSWQRRRARERGLADPAAGSVTFVQRFGSALNLHVHFHAVLPDGVLVRPEGGEPGSLSFVELPPPTDLDVTRLTDRLARRLTALFSEPDERPLEDEEEALVASWAESLRRSRREGEPDPDDSSAPGSLCALIEGFSLHAATHVGAEDRPGLERLLRYGARPGFSQKRLSLREDGRVVYSFRKPWHTGQTELVMEPVQFLRRLAAILPPPRQNQLRFHGLFASRARNRAAVAALLPPRDTPEPVAASASETPVGDARVVRPRKLLWAALLKRVFAEDVLVCPRCEGPMRLIAVLTDPEIVRGVLRHLGLPTDPPTVAPARAPPQAELFERPS